MAYKKHNWIKYGRSSDFIEISIKDHTGRRIDFFRCNNKKDYKNILDIIKNKHGWDYNFKIDIKDPTSYEDEMSWLKKKGII